MPVLSIYIPLDTLALAISHSYYHADCYIQVYLSGKLHLHGDATSEPYKPTFLATCLMVVLQPSGYSVFHGGDTPIQLSLS